jgi:hypothetical protein
MPMQKKQNILLIIIALLIVSTGLFAILWYQKKPNEVNNLPPQQKVQEWQTYYNPKYHFKMDYPGELHSASYSTFEDAIFVGSNDAWQIEVKVEEKTSLHTPEEWIKLANKKIEEDAQYFKMHETPPLLEVEATTTISGAYEGVVVNQKSTEDLGSRVLVFIKDGNLFQITVRNFIDHERIWNSFKFE